MSEQGARRLLFGLALLLALSVWGDDVLRGLFFEPEPIEPVRVARPAGHYWSMDCTTGGGGDEGCTISWDTDSSVMYIETLELDP